CAAHPAQQCVKVFTLAVITVPGAVGAGTVPIRARRGTKIYCRSSYDSDNQHRSGDQPSKVKADNAFHLSSSLRDSLEANNVPTARKMYLYSLSGLAESRSMSSN